MSVKQMKLNEINKVVDWDAWLEDLDIFLKDKGYLKYHQNYKRETFAYWKKFDSNYQIGLLIYDFRKYKEVDANANRISIQFEFMFVDIEERIDLSVSKALNLAEFEEMGKVFYETMKHYSSNSRT